jgi:outer membrane protein with beta-barrel domain
MRFKLFLLLTLAAALPLQAQNLPWKWHFGLGYPISTGTTSDAANGVFRLETGGIKPFHPNAGFRFDIGWDRFHPTSKIENLYQAQGGYANVWSATAGLQYNFTRTASGMGFYTFGGIGTHYKQAYLTEPGVAWWCDPWWGICYPVGADVVKGKKTDTAVGASGGLGMSWPLMRGTEFYVETKYQWINGSRIDVEYIPVTLGWRW